MDKQNLESRFHGQVILPDDPTYDSARQVFYGDINKRPAAIIRVADAEDIKRAIALAKEEGLELAIRSGGHSIAGYGTTDGGIVIDLRNMKKIQIDDDSKTGWAEAGLTAGEVSKTLDSHNLVLGFGDIGSVGIGGITLGGGVGFLTRKFGLTIDNLLAAEIVTADGQILEVDEKNHADLFWAIKGGGGNFGVVTKFKYQFHELGECYGGMLLLPISPEVIAGCVKLASEAPDELSTIINIMPAFPIPTIPKEYHGKLSVVVQMVYAGDPNEGEKVAAPFKALAKPYADLTKPMRYKDIFPPENEGLHPTAVSKNLHLKKVDLDVASTAIDWLQKLDAPMKALQLRVLGGAMARVPEDNTAYAHRNQAIMANVAAFYQADQEKTDRKAWVDSFADALNQGDSTVYVGFLGQADQNRTLDVYPADTLEKLKKVKQKYDPDNLFKLNFNILKAHQRQV